MVVMKRVRECRTPVSELFANEFFKFFNFATTVSRRFWLGVQFCKVEPLPEAKIGDVAVVGLRVSQSLAEPLDLWFDADKKQLVAIDYTDTRHLFSQWKTTAEGHKYPSHVAGYRFADPAARKTQDKQWYQTDILELTPLAELPAGLEP